MIRSIEIQLKQYTQGWTWHTDCKYIVFLVNVLDLDAELLNQQLALLFFIPSNIAA